MRNLVGEENVEKQLAHQLVHQFKKELPKLMLRNKALTNELWELIEAITKRIDELDYVLIGLNEAIKEGKLGIVEQEEQALRDHIIVLEKEIGAATVVEDYLSRWEPVPAIRCTPEFRERLQTDSYIKQRLGELEKLLMRMLNPSWLQKNHKGLYSSDDLPEFSLIFIHNTKCG